MSTTCLPVRAQPLASSAAGPITFAGQSIKVSIADATLTEPPYGGGVMRFPVTLSRPSSVPVEMEYFTRSGSASGYDFGSNSSNYPRLLTIPAGETSAEIAVYIADDETPEYDETFTVQLRKVTGAVLANGSATGTILDDGDNAVLLVESEGVREGNTGERFMNVKISLFTLFFNPKTERPISFTLATKDGVGTDRATAGSATAGSATAGSATAGSDYIPVQVSATIMPGKTSTIIKIPVKGDTQIEEDETIGVVIDAPGSDVLPLGDLVIFDDDAPPTTSGRLIYSTWIDSYAPSVIESIKMSGASRQGLTTSDSSSYGPVVSPDGSKIAFLSNRDEVKDEDGETGSEDIYVMDRSGGNVQRLTTSGISKPDLCWSPDGSKIAFTTIDDEYFKKVFIMSANGSGLRALFPSDDYFSTFSPTFHPNGKQILYFRRRFFADNLATLCIANLNGTGVRVIDIGNVDPIDFAISPDGKYVAVNGVNAKDTQSIQIIGLEGQGTKITRLRSGTIYGGPSGRYGYGVQFSHDGKLLYFIDRSSKLNSLKIATGQTRNLLRGTYDFVDDYYLSPDGKSIAVGSRRRIGTVASKGGFIHYIPGITGYYADFIGDAPVKPALAAPAPSDNAS